jgi:hypothetical protein
MLSTLSMSHKYPTGVRGCEIPAADLCHRGATC